MPRSNRLARLELSVNNNYLVSNHVPDSAGALNSADAYWAGTCRHASVAPPQLYTIKSMRLVLSDVATCRGRGAPYYFFSRGSQPIEELYTINVYLIQNECLESFYW